MWESDGTIVRKFLRPMVPFLPRPPLATWGHVCKEGLEQMTSVLPRRDSSVGFGGMRWWQVGGVPAAQGAARGTGKGWQQIALRPLSSEHTQRQPGDTHTFPPLRPEQVPTGGPAASEQRVSRPRPWLSCPGDLAAAQSSCH